MQQQFVTYFMKTLTIFDYCNSKKTDIRNSMLYTAALILMYSYKYNNIQTEQRFPRKALAESIASVHSE